MKTLRYVILLSLAAALLAGCGTLPPLMPNAAGPTAAVAVATEAPAAEAPAAEAPATEAAPAAAQDAATAAPAPTTEAAPEAQATPEPGQPTAANPLAGTVWEWAALIKTQPAMQSVVPDPSSYTVVFGADGQMAIKADCNNARATYVLENDALTITLGAVTRAACPPGSLSADFLTNLSKVGSYTMDNGDLVLKVPETNGSMIFRNGGPAEPAPAEPAPAATEAPAGAPAEAGAPQLVGPTWEWESFADVATGKNSFDVTNPENYTVTFVDDGTAAMRADCNRAAGTYTVNGASLNVMVGPVTLAACEGDSRGAQFLINLTSAGTFTFVDGKLAIDLQADGGRMVFRAAK